MNKDDLIELLVTAEQKPMGAYNHASWQILTNGNVQSPEALIVSVHEFMHHLLNNTSSYGLLMVVTAKLERLGQCPNGTLLKQVIRCRDAHETFATCASLLVLSPDYSKHEFIKHYPDYTKYTKTGFQLLAGLNGFRYQYPALLALFRFCFQSQNLKESLHAGSPWDTLEDTPDERLVYLTQNINKSFWQQLKEAFLKRNTNDQNVIQYFSDRHNDMPDIVKHEDQLNQLFCDFVYAYVIEAFPKLRTLPNDEHLTYVNDLLNFAKGKFPEDQDIELRLNDEDEICGLSQFELESIVFNEQKLPAISLTLKDIPHEQFDDLQVKAEGSEYIYIISRITEQFVQQYLFGDDEKQDLLKRYPDFINAIVVKQLSEDKRTYLLFVVLEKPEEIDELGDRYFIISNSSMLLSSDEHWASWHNCLDVHSTHTTVFDLPPSQQLHNLSTYYDQMSYVKYQITLDEHDYLFICLFCTSESGGSGLFVIPCSSVAAELCVEYLKQNITNAVAFDTENDQRKIGDLCRLLLSHLIYEGRFSFRSLDTQYAQRCFQQDRFELG